MYQSEHLPRQSCDGRTCRPICSQRPQATDASRPLVFPFAIIPYRGKVSSIDRIPLQLGRDPFTRSRWSDWLAVCAGWAACAAERRVHHRYRQRSCRTFWRAARLLSVLAGLSKTLNLNVGIGSLLYAIGLFRRRSEACFYRRYFHRSFDRRNPEPDRNSCVKSMVIEKATRDLGLVSADISAHRRAGLGKRQQA